MKIKILLFLLLITDIAIGQIPKPADTFGFEPGADYKMATYDQMLAYYEKLDAATDRVKVTEIGKSVRGRPIKLVFISSEENMKSLDKWKSISEKMARARISETEAQQLACAEQLPEESHNNQDNTVTEAIADSIEEA